MNAERAGLGSRPAHQFIRDDERQQSTATSRLWDAAMRARILGDEREADELETLWRLYDEADRIIDELERLREWQPVSA